MKIKTAIAFLGGMALACGEKPKAPVANQPQWVTQGAMKATFSRDEAQRIYETQLKKRHRKGSSFRNEEISAADNKTLGFIAGGNFAELSIGLILKNKTLIDDAAKGMAELGKRSGNVGDYAWAKDLVGTIERLESGAIDFEQGSSEIDVIAQKFIQAAAKGNEDFAIQTIAGFKFFTAGVLMGVGKPSKEYSPFLTDYLALYEKNIDAESLANLRKVQELAGSATTEAEWNVAGNLLLKTLGQIKLA
jgi:hypothetical protein